MSSPPPSKRQKTGTMEKTGTTGTKAKSGRKETVTKEKTGTEGTKEKKITRLYNQEGPTRKGDRMVVDRDDQLPEKANKLNHLAEIFWNAGCQTCTQIATEEQALKCFQYFLG